MQKDKIKELINSKKNLTPKELLNKLKETSLLEFRKNINNAQKIKPNQSLNEEVVQYYEKILETYNPNEQLFQKYIEILNHFQKRDYEYLDNYKDLDILLDNSSLIKLTDIYHYKNSNEIAKEYLQKRTNQIISEIIIDSLFQDTIYNVWRNIKELLNYNKEINILNQDQISFYHNIVNIDKLSHIEKIKIYKEYKDKKLNLLLYEDIRKMKDISYQQINNSLYHPKNNNTQILNGEEFYMLVKCMAKYQEIAPINRHCYSLISHNNLNVFNQNKIIYGYTDISIEYISHVSSKDAYSSPDDNSLEYGYINEIKTKEQLTQNDNYNEIQIINKKIDNNQYQSLKPSYIVVFDKIRDIDKEESIRLNIPIIIIKKESYLKNKSTSNNNSKQSYLKELNQYTNGSNLEEIRRMTRK